MGVICFLIFAILIAIPITAVIYWNKDRKEKKEKQKIIQNIESYTNNIDITNMSEDDYKKEILKATKNINISLVDIQREMQRQNEKLEDIKGDIGIITLVIVLPIIIGIITFIMSAVAGYNILQNLFQ